MPISYLLMLNLLTGALDVDVQISQQPAVQGTLTSLDETGLGIRVGQEDRQIPLKSLLVVSLPGSAGLTPEKYNSLIELVDQSILAATDYQVKAATAHIALVGGAKVSLPTRAIRSVRFQVAGERDEKSNQQWSEILAMKVAADLLVVRKKGSLDYLEGVLQDVDAEGLKFELDHEPIPVKRPKLEGLIYYHEAGDPPADPVCEVSAVGGTRVKASTLRLVERALKITSPGGLELTLPVEQISRCDFSSGKIVYLSDLEPDSADYTPYFGLTEPLPALTDFYRPRRDVALEHGPLKLDGKTYRKGLAAHSRSKLAYRLPGNFSHFQAVVGIDDNVRDGGNARLEIKGDGKSLWQGTLRGTEAAQSIDIPLAGIRRLEILVDFGDDLDIADHVDLCDARVTK